MTAERDPLILAARIASPWGGASLEDIADFGEVAGVLERNKVSFLELERRLGAPFRASPLQAAADRERAFFDAHRAEFERVRLDLAAHDVPTMLFKSTGLYPSFPHLSSNLDVLVPWGRGDAGRERLYHLGYIEIINVEEPVKYLFRRFAAGGLCFTFHLHEQVGWGVPFVSNDTIWEGSRPAPDDPGITIPGPRDGLLVTTAHWFYEDKVLTLENLFLTANALCSFEGDLDEAADHAGERGWRDGFYLGLRVFDRAWRRLFDEGGLSAEQRETVDRGIRELGLESSAVLKNTAFPAAWPARIPFMGSKRYWLRKLWRDRRRSPGQKVKDFFLNAVWTVRSQLHVITQKPFLVTLSGCDGSGKTVQAEALAGAFETCDMRVATVWSRGASSRLSGSLIRLGKFLFGGRATPAPDAAGPTEADRLAARRGYLQRPAARALFSLVYAAELFWTWGVKTRWMLLRGHAVVCDRYVADAIVDFAVLSGKPLEDTPAALRWLQRLAPAPHVSFLLDVIEGEALARKPEEGSAEHLADARRALWSLAGPMDMTVMPAHLSQQQVYESVVHETLSRFYLRYRTVINALYLSNPGQMNPGAWRATRVYRQDPAGS